MKEYLANNWIAILALAISIIALLKDIIKDIIQKKKEDTNNKKAIITARIINKELIISNIGKSDARIFKYLQMMKKLINHYLEHFQDKKISHF